ncbi:AIG1 family protein [Reticulomyxa filosa]|uniref:AIG1 family protein n=1 Tax=Reticulomyxa filosa TaxID=46433 RepID=X6NND0_RETFI|nr:AIG1 family protein [Reticulomyxa filosa]|eukprot:ETO27795.1 AIG1 family protein [Reticulomyxa filosa]
MERRIQEAKAQQAQLSVSCSEQTKKYNEAMREHEAMYQKRLKDLKEENEKRIKEAKEKAQKELQQKQYEIEKFEREYNLRLKLMNLEEIKEKCDVLETMAKRCETIKSSHENDLQQKKTEHLLLAKQVEDEGTLYLSYVSFVQKKKKKKQSQFCAKFKEELKDMESLRVLLYSPTGEGKSTLGNRILGDESPDGNKGPFEVSDGIDSKTQDISKQFLAKGKLYKHSISVIDCPGTFDSNYRDRQHANNLVAYLQGIQFINAIVLVKNYQHPRIDDNYNRFLQELQTMFGVNVWKHAIIVFTKFEGRDTKKLELYQKQFVEDVRRRIACDATQAPLPVVPISNLEDYKTKVQHLVDIEVAKMLKFSCEHLRSPLEELAVKLGLAKTYVDIATSKYNQAAQEHSKLLQCLQTCTQQRQQLLVRYILFVFLVYTMGYIYVCILQIFVRINTLKRQIGGVITLAPGQKATYNVAKDFSYYVSLGEGSVITFKSQTGNAININKNIWGNGSININCSVNLNASIGVSPPQNELKDLLIIKRVEKEFEEKIN